MVARKRTGELSYGIIGLGRFGSAPASMLAEVGKKIMVLDCNKEKVRQIRSSAEHVYVVKDLQKEALREAGIRNCDVVVACIRDKMDVDVLTTLNMTNLEVPQIVAKANNLEQGEILGKIGAQMMYPERDMVPCLTKHLISGRASNLSGLDHNIDISGFKPTSRPAGQTVPEAQLRNRYGVNVIAIGRNGWLTTDITPDYTPAEGDTLVVIGERDKIKRLEGALQECSINMAEKVRGLW